ncbi:alanine--tRNA ligase [Candidatus Collierbacteria bacterium]|nr:alanine--tRNA ligase [Candidatus Collierbacteria bacterium]
MSSAQIRQKYLKFFAARGHAVIPSAPLVPENDPTTLFTGSGMQPMLPYLLGQDHPLGTRLVDSQRCFRAQDIEEVGDNRHDTFFEMLGNWSLGDYFKKEQQTWIWEFLTKELGLNPLELYVSVFKGNDQVPRDEEASGNWKSLGVSSSHISYYGVNKNWWARSSYADMPIGEPGGPDSEIFYDFGQKLLLHENSIYKNDQCHPNCDCGRFMEIGNNVFMAYKKTLKGFEQLGKKNIDFGGGLERLTAATNNDPDIFKTDLFWPLIEKLQTISGLKYAEFEKPMRIITDHLKASLFLITDGVMPNNKAQGYFLRRLLRRSMVKIQQLKINLKLEELVDDAILIYKSTDYFKNTDSRNIKRVIAEEGNKFEKTLRDGLKKVGLVSAFDLFQSYGFPKEIIEELCAEKQIMFDKEKFEKEIIKHQELSRTASKGMFKGGLADNSEEVTKLHTATHLLHAALRKFIGTHVQQKGSNINSERLRFDFIHNSKLAEKEKSVIENWINQQITKDLPVSCNAVSLQKAKEEGALAFFGEKYGEKVNVYTIGDEKTGIVSIEVCGGPHVARTGGLGIFKLGKEESVSAGIKRVYAFLKPK